MMRTLIVFAVCLSLHLTATSRADPLASRPNSISPVELSEAIRTSGDELVVLDVRTPQEFAAGHVPGARNIPHDLIGERLSALEDAREREIVVYCRSGRRAGIAMEALRAAGFARVRHLEGDLPAWQAVDLPVQDAPSPAAAAAPP